MKEKKWRVSDPDIQVDVDTLVEYMQTCWQEQPEQVIPYEELANTIMKPNVRHGRGLYCLQKARKVFRDKYHMLVLCVKNEGVRWAKNEMINSHLRKRLGRSRKQAKKLIRESSTFKLGDCSKEQKAQFLTYQNLAGVIIAFSSKKSIEKTNDAMMISPTRANTAKMIEMFQKENV